MLALSSENIILLGTLLLVLMVTAIIVFVVNYQKFVLKLERDKITLEKRNEELLAEATVRSQENQQKKIGEELHDDISPIFVTALMNLNNYTEKVDTEIDWNIDNAIKNIELGIEKLRSVSHQLHTASIDNFGFIFALKDFIHNLNNTKGVAIQLNASVDDINLTPFEKLTLYRIAQELVLNAIKHSKARQIILKLIENEDNLFIYINQDGLAFQLEEFNKGIKKSDALGLKIMQQRLNLLKSRIKFNPGSHWQAQSIEIQVPLM